MDDIPSFLIVVVVAVLLCLIMGGACGVGVRDVRTKAIEHGVAHWTVNPESGVTSFEWITCTEIENVEDAETNRGN